MLSTTSKKIKISKGDKLVVKKPKDPAPVSVTLGGWSDIIRKQGEESRRKHEATLAALLEGKAAEAKKIRKLSDDDLLNKFVAFSTKYDMDPRVRAVFEELTAVARKEISKRMRARHAA